VSELRTEALGSVVTDGGPIMDAMMLSEEEAAVVDDRSELLPSTLTEAPRTTDHISQFRESKSIDQRTVKTGL